MKLLPRLCSLVSLSCALSLTAPEANATTQDCVVTLEETIAASDGENLDHFGVAIVIDGGFAAVSAPRRSDRRVQEGRVETYCWDGKTWVHDQSLTSPQPRRKGLFGGALALEGSTLVVGEYGVDIVNLYQRSGGSWQLEQRLESFDRGSFGSAVAIDDGVLAVGAPLEFSGDSAAGRVHVFRKQAGTWVSSQVVTPPFADYHGYFGFGLATGEGQLIVGEPGDSTVAIQAGAAHFYALDDLEEYQLERSAYPSDGVSSGYFGFAVAFDAELAAIGSPDMDGGDGAVYAYRHGRSGWREAGKLSPTDAGHLNTMGRSVAVSDGRILAGAPSFGHIDPPSVLAFSQGRMWYVDFVLRASGESGTGGFGSAVAAWGDRLLIGAPTAAERGIHPGLAYSYNHHLALGSDANDVTTGDNLTLTVCGAEFWALGVLAVVSVDGAPVFQLIPRILSFDSDGRASLPLTVPPLGPTTLGLKAFARRDQFELWDSGEFELRVR